MVFISRIIAFSFHRVQYCLTPKIQILARIAGNSPSYSYANLIECVYESMLITGIAVNRQFLISTVWHIHI